MVDLAQSGGIVEGRDSPFSAGEGRPPPGQVIEPAEQLAQLVSSIDPTQQSKLQAALEQIQS